jgi:site-specific DNA-cytosine methylase
MNRPKLLDLFCCAGGAGMGYSRAEFDVYGVDIDPQPNYPFPFHQDDALGCLDRMVNHNGRSVFRGQSGPEFLALDDFDAIHASPPCQGYTALAAVHGNEWPKLYEPVKELLEATGLPYVIENVQGSPVRRDLTLCGEMFGLGVIRHRYFELGRWTGIAPTHKAHRGRVAGMRHGEWFTGPYFAVYGEGGGKGTVAQWQQAMGIDWTDVRREIAEAIPPAYTEHIGRQLLDHLMEAVA